MILLGLGAAGPTASAAEPADTTTTTQLDDFVIVSDAATRRKMGGVTNTERIGQVELCRAACCNLGESFSTSPSVDVNYSDAATGAKQIKLLGLPGTYVQLLTENMPAFRGAASPYALRYVPGTWMKSIQVSKGVASVKNGYEAMTGQIDIEYLKPQDPQGVSLNAYFDSNLKLELNADGNWHITDKLNTEVLAHFENGWETHDSNKDGFYDMPRLRQYNFQNRWNYLGHRYIFHGGLTWLKENARGGQMHAKGDVPRFRIDMDADRYEAYMKHAFILNHEHNTNIALMANGAMHRLDAGYGHNFYGVNEKNVYAQLLFEHDFNERHNLATGLSLNFPMDCGGAPTSRTSVNFSMMKAKNWLPPKKASTSTLMPGYSARSFSVSALRLAAVICSNSSCPAMEGTLPMISDVTSMILRMNRTERPGAGSSSSGDMAQKPFLR